MKEYLFIAGEWDGHRIEIPANIAGKEMLEMPFKKTYQFAPPVPLGPSGTIQGQRYFRREVGFRRQVVYVWEAYQLEDAVHALIVRYPPPIPYKA